ncbi:MAG: cation diffusion facilitator family transporter [Desulfuromonadaceae bacterium]
MDNCEKVALLSILVNLLLVGIKGVLAVVSGSLAIQADTIHSLSDGISSLVILIGIRISKRSSRRFPYGLYKVENLVALGTSLLIFLAGYEILTDVFLAPSRPLPGHLGWAVVGIGATILITWLFSRYELKKGIETGSPSLVADARHIGTDMLSSVVILASLLGGAAGLALDRLAALVVVFFIGRTAFTIFLDAVRVLLDASLDPESLEKIRQLVTEEPRVLRINELRARNAGRYKFVELDLTLHVKNLEKGHQLVEELKRRIRHGLDMVDHVQIHYQPESKDHRILGVPLCEDQRTLCSHFGEAPYFRLLTLWPRDGRVTRDALLSNPYSHEPKAKGIKVANWLLEQGLDLMVVCQKLEGKGPGFVLGDAEVEILVVEDTEVETVLAGVKADLAS